MKTEKFVVDAFLLRELGERLIGRPTIALGELAKNSYDADAATCLVEFREDELVISDNGTGMSESEFLDHWMRIGTTHKVDQQRSKILGRSLTGSKGVGRLSVQFLADEMILESTSATQKGKSLYVIVDWKSIIRGASLDTVSVGWEMRRDTLIYPSASPTGTRITLRKLKSKWDIDAIRELGAEVWMLRSPFRSNALKDEGRSAENFDIEIDAPEIANAKDVFDERLRAVLSNWRARILGVLDGGRSGGKASITVEFRREYPEGSKKPRHFKETLLLPVRSTGVVHGKPLLDRVEFEILVFKPEGKQTSGISVVDLRKYLSTFGNVSVYDAGFRLPYYGSGRDAAGQDWLSIALDQGRRLNASELLPENLRTLTKYMQDLPAPGRIFGAVEIDTNHERAVAGAGARPGTLLQIQPGRDRLHDNPPYFQLRDLVRFSLDFYANRYRYIDFEIAEKTRAQESPSKKFSRLLTVLERNRKTIPSSVFSEIKREATEAHKASLAEEESLDRRAVLLAPLASAGMAALALNHELSRESNFLSLAGARLRELATLHSIEALSEIADEFETAKNRLESLQELFEPLLSDIDKTATDRLKVRAVVDQAVNSMRVLVPGIVFDLSQIPRGLRFPLGSLAEWNALIQNVISNAWNAMLESERTIIGFRGGGEGSGREWLHVSDSGKGLGLSLSESSQLFEPFERRQVISEDKRSIALGGQGLGLAIVRMIARRRAAQVRFIAPEGGFSTTFEMSWRGPKS